MPDRLDVLVIGGCGHVGLPLGMLLARSGLQVGLHDTDEARRTTVARGEMPFLEYGAEPVLAETLGRTLHVVEEIVPAHTIVVTIGTPVDEYLNPAFGPMFDVARALLPVVADGAHVMLRSTVYPGTTRELARFFERAGVDVEVSYCPERIVQGYAITELDRLPQIVSGFSERAVEEALTLFRRLTDRLIVVEVEEAELTKLFLNAWRYLQFAIANQFYMVAEELGADFFRIHHAMTEGYERASDFPLSGFTAGPCLLKDTMQLSAFQRGNFQLGLAAMQVNEGLANFVVDKLARKHDLSGKRVGILGMAFKANIDDTRDSLAYKLRKILLFHGAEVRSADPYVDDPRFVPAEELVEWAEVVIVGAPHEAFRELQIPDEKEVVDVWGFFRRTPVPA